MSNLEQNFKDAFEKHELPYNAGAWNALSDKLDKLQVTPTKANPSNNWKWISGVAVLALVTTVLIYTATFENKQVKAETATETKASDSKIPISEETTTVPTTERNELSLNEVAAENATTDRSVTPVTNRNAKGNSLTQQTSSPSEGRNSTAGHERIMADLNYFLPIHIENSEKIKFPEIAEVCEGTVVAIPNKNKTAIILVSPSGKETEIKAYSSIYFTLSESGTYSFVSKNSSEMSVFAVKEAPKVDFTIDMGEIYEDGIPSIAVQALTQGNNFVWSFEGSSIKQRGAQAKAHFYKKGPNEVILTSKGGNGCEASISKEITIDEDYNLMAMTAFNATGNNPKTNRFIPGALLYRNTEFKLYIIEPRSGVVIFETSSLEGWNGINTTTNQLVEENKTFIWKVVLANPEPEEKREYKGIVTRL